MKTSLPGLPTAFLLPIALLFVGCVSTPIVDKTVVATYKEGLPGGTYLETYQTSAKVVAINAVTREMTFTAPDRSTNTFRAGPRFASFGSYHVGDEVKVTVARELAMFPGGEIPPTTNSPAAIVRAAPGTQPGVLVADTQEITAKVLAVHPRRQSATLGLSDGRTVTFSVRKDIDLAQVKIGEAVAIRTSAAMAVLLEKP